MLVVCLVPAVAVWYSLREQDLRSGEQQFELHVRELINAIDKRLREHEQILLGGAGLFDASRTVTRSDWNAYVARLRLAETHPGIQGVGFAALVAPEQLPVHVAAVRQEGFPDYVVHPPGKRDVYTSTVYLEPFSGRNLAAFGYDMFSEATRREAMTQAAQAGRTAISGKVKLVQETHGEPQAGFLMYVPVYRPGASLDGAAARWQALRGFVFSPYRVADLMRGILGEGSRNIDFRLYDGDGGDESLMYASERVHSAKGLAPAALFATRRHIEAYGHRWTIDLESRREFEGGLRSGFEWLALGLGAGVSLLIGALTWVLVGSREQALALANGMTRQIRDNEKRLADTNKRFALAVDSAGIGVWEYDIVAGSLLWDERMYRLYGVEQGEFEGAYAAWNSRLHPDDRARAETELNAAIDGGRDFDTTFRIVRRDGEVRHLRAYAHVERNAESRPLRMIGVNYDVTARETAAAALHESARYTQAILDNVLDGIVAIDEHGIVNTFNKGAERIFGFDAGEVTGRNVSMLMPEPHRGRHDDYLHNYLSTGRKRIIGIGREVAGQRKDGSLFAMELSVSEIARAGRPTFIGLVHDITERKQAERMKSEFVSTVSHELRTPLTSISGALGLLAGGVLGVLPEQARQLVDIASKNSQRLIHLINDLLDMEKIAAGKLHFNLTMQPLMPLVDQALAANQAYGAQYRVRFAIVARADDVTVNIDGQRFLQILSNFLSNAAKFSPEGGVVEVGVYDTGDHVRVAVRDYGAGIPDSFRDRIFEKFSQADSSDTRQKGGTGLGLVITRELAQHMGGTVGFESATGMGTTFWCDFPLGGPARRPLKMPQLVPGAPAILVVEDDNSTAGLLVAILNFAGYRVDRAGSGGEALAALQRGGYAAMTVDLNLPDMSGLEVIRQTRARRETAALPIVVVSASIEAGPLAEAADCKGVEWLAKPFDSAHLLAAVAQSSALAAPVGEGRPSILHVEDDADFHQIVRAMIGERFELGFAPSLASARAQLARRRFDAVLLDLALPDGSGWELLPELRGQQPAPGLVVLAGEAAFDGVRGKDDETLLIKGRFSSADLIEALSACIAASKNRP